MSSNYIDRLPDELLLEILKISMHHEGQFYPEFCVHNSKESRRAQHPSRPGHQQRPHLNDWCIVSATSRNIRRVGREAFFSSKTIAMSFSLPQQLREGTFSAFGTPADQTLALRYIRAVNFVDMMTACPSTLIELPEILQGFPKLKNVLLSFGYSVYDQDLSVLRCVRELDDPWLILLLLYEIGVPRRVTLYMGIHKQVWAEDFFEIIELQVRPRLRDEADRIQESRCEKTVA
ncbi:hypothetical protein F5X97DRAFT_326424 [Nemania serpens]|nr:hypothetical protein F5X97DRAFT_326424 [Nemania serpens]